MTSHRVLTCDVCQWKDDGNLQVSHTDITDTGMGVLMDKDEPPEHLCLDCYTQVTILLRKWFEESQA